MSDLATHDTTPSRPAHYWVWPLRTSSSFANRVSHLTQRLHDWQSKAGRWFLMSLLVGCAPVLLSYAISISVDRLLTTIMLVPLLLAAVRGDSTRQAVGILLTIFAAHNVCVIMFTWHNAAYMAQLIPFGEDYWQETIHWIRTGKNPEYALSSWVPAHVQALFGVPIASYVTVGGALPAQGIYQVDMMNVYVGNLLAVSDRPLIALGLGWHPWSMLRGIGFLFLGIEAVSYSLQRLIHQTLSTRSHRQLRWGAGVCFLTLDAIVKLTCMESVREILQANLVESGG